MRHLPAVLLTPSLQKCEAISATALCKTFACFWNMSVRTSSTTKSLRLNTMCSPRIISATYRAWFARSIP